MHPCPGQAAPPATVLIFASARLLRRAQASGSRTHPGERRAEKPAFASLWCQALQGLIDVRSLRLGNGTSSQMPLQTPFSL